MTRSELASEIYCLVGDWRKVGKILNLVGRLTPDPGQGNLLDINKAKVPAYNGDLVRKVGRRKMKFTPQQKAAAREVLRELGMI